MLGGHRDETHLAELKVVRVFHGLRGRVRAHGRGAGNDGHLAGNASAANGDLRANGGTGRDGRRAHHRHSHRSHFSLACGCWNELSGADVRGFVRAPMGAS